MSEWKIGTISEVCSLVTDGSHFSPKSSENGKYMVSVKDFKEFGFDFTNCKRISNDDYEKLKLSGCIPERDDILIGKDGARFFEDIIIYNQPEKPALLSSIAILRCNTDVILPRFLYYICKNPIFKKDVRDNYGSGSAIPRIVLKDFKRMPIYYPDLTEQRRIVATLVAIDDRIAVNTKINDNLEQQAQAIFKAWFVDFLPFGGVMPDDWRIGTFSDIIESTLGGDWGKEMSTGNYTERVYCIRGADIPEVKAGNKGKMPTRFILPKNFNNKKLIAGDIVVEISGGSPTQSTGRVASISESLLERYDSGMICTNFCRAIKPFDGYSNFIYYYWQYLYNRNVFFSYENGTTGIKNLDISGFIETEPINIPPVYILQQFNSVISSFQSQIFGNGQEIEKLATLRDSLLPKLMNGEIDVSAVRI